MKEVEAEIKDESQRNIMAWSMGIESKGDYLLDAGCESSGQQFFNYFR